MTETKRVPVAELNALVAEIREPMPLKCLFGCEALSESGEWLLGWSLEVESWAWQPRHDYTCDISAAWRLFEDGGELVGIHSLGIGNGWKVSWRDGNSWRFITAGTAPVAIVLAWLAWKGVEVEVCDGV